MKTNLFGWVGIAILLSTAACSKSPEGFCESWVEETCKAITSCCEAGKSYDENECRLSLSKSCQDAVEVELVHSGERAFDSGAASDCFPTVKTCAEFDALRSGEQTFEHRKACANVVTGYRPPGAACTKDTQCQAAGELAYCYDPSGVGVCVEVAVDEATCSFSFAESRLQLCADGKYCDLAGYEPSATASPTSSKYEFSASCKPNVAAGGKCVSDKGDPLPCATGLYCDYSAGDNATCKALKAAGSQCQMGQECVAGLVCQSSGSGKTCQKDDALFCYSPPKCGDGDCNGDETAATCPSDCHTGGGGGGCGDGVCDFNNGEPATCPDDCCGDGFCDAGESAVCPTDCQG